MTHPPLDNTEAWMLEPEEPKFPWVPVVIGLMLALIGVILFFGNPL